MNTKNKAASTVIDNGLDNRLDTTNNHITVAFKRQPSHKNTRKPRHYRGYDRDEVDGKTAFTARRDIPEVCPYCSGDISKGDQYTRVSKGIWHLKCKLKDEQGIKSPWGGLQV